MLVGQGGRLPIHPGGCGVVYTGAGHLQTWGWRQEVGGRGGGRREENIQQCDGGSSMDISSILNGSLEHMLQLQLLICVNLFITQ